MGQCSIPRIGSHRSSLISLITLNYCIVLTHCMLCCAWLATIALHVHCGMGKQSPLPTSWGFARCASMLNIADGQIGADYATYILNAMKIITFAYTKSAVFILGVRVASWPRVGHTVTRWYARPTRLNYL